MSREVVHLSVLAGDRREVGHVHGDLALQLDLVVVALRQQAAHLLGRPALVLAPAAARPGAPGFCTRMQPWLNMRIGLSNSSRCGRVVHVDVVLVGEQELDDAQHVVGARRLDEGEAADVDLSPSSPMRDRPAGRCRRRAAAGASRIEVSPPPKKGTAAAAADRYGASSLTLMESGTPHSGWKTMERMLAENTAVGVSGLPTMIFAEWITWPFLKTRVMNSGMLSQTCSSPRCSGIQRQRSMLAIRRCTSEPASAGLAAAGCCCTPPLSADARARRQDAGGLDVVLPLERLERVLHLQVEDVLRAARQRQAEPLAQQWRRADARCRA